MAYWQQMTSKIWINVGSGNGLLPDDTKPLPEPMLTYHQLGPIKFIWWQFYKRYPAINHFFVWKSLPSNLPVDIELDHIPPGLFSSVVNPVTPLFNTLTKLQWRHNEHDGVSNHQPHDCLFNRLLKAHPKEDIKAPRHWTLWGELTGDRWRGIHRWPVNSPHKRASNADWWRHHTFFQ